MNKLNQRILILELSGQILSIGKITPCQLFTYYSNNGKYTGCYSCKHSCWSGELGWILQAQGGGRAEQSNRGALHSHSKVKSLFHFPFFHYFHFFSPDLTFSWILNLQFKCTHTLDESKQTCLFVLSPDVHKHIRLQYTSSTDFSKQTSSRIKSEIRSFYNKYTK